MRFRRTVGLRETKSIGLNVCTKGSSPFNTNSSHHQIWTAGDFPREFLVTATVAKAKKFASPIAAAVTFSYDNDASSARMRKPFAVNRSTLTKCEGEPRLNSFRKLIHG